MFYFSGDLVPDLICIVVFGVAYAREGILGVVGDNKSHRIEPQTPSPLVHTRYLSFCLSEFLVTLLGKSVEWHHNRCKEAN